MEKRANRRHHKDRMKAKARRVAMVSWGVQFEHDPEKAEKRLKKAERYADHLKVCSCSSCCNLRSKNSWCGVPTRQEILAYIKFLEETGYENKVKHISHNW